ncbi:MAG: (2Fe-2S)-binding protein, partial [Candidatus Bathyarchaeota archaeon]
MNLRIREHPILEFERGTPIHMTLNGNKIEAYEGETIVAALYAAGVKNYSQSVKYGRPRGFFCGIGKCASCLMRVNGVSRVRTCVTLVKHGMKIEYEKGRDSPSIVSEEEVTEEKVDTNLIVIGGGPAGLSAAVTAANLGAEVFSVDENPRPGGQLIKQTHKFFGSKYNYAGSRGIEIAKTLLGNLKDANARWIVNASAVGYYESKKHLLAVVQNNHKLVEASANQIIVSTGAR